MGNDGTSAVVGLILSYRTYSANLVYLLLWGHAFYKTKDLSTVHVFVHRYLLCAAPSERVYMCEGESSEI